MRPPVERRRWFPKPRRTTDVFVLIVKALLIVYVIWKGGNDIDWQMVLWLILRHG